jgi:hypothetical protein
LVECDVVPLDGVPAVRQIVKVRHPHQQHGLVFLGTFIVPKARCSAVLKVQCVEHGVTGIRESVVIASLGLGAMLRTHPYAPDVDPVALGGLPANAADQPQYDQQFGDHPLTRLRRLLDRLAATARVADGFRLLPPFPGPGR